MSCAGDQTEIKVGEDQGDVVEASACYSGGKADHKVVVNKAYKLSRSQLQCIAIQ